MASKRNNPDAASGTVESAAWPWYSVDQYHAANFFSRKSAELEEQDPPAARVVGGLNLDPFPSDDHHSHRSYVMATILSSVTFLEASLNELLASVGDDSLPVGGGRGSLTSTERQTLMTVRGMIENNRFLDRFQLVLYSLGREPFDRGSPPYQDADRLVKLRNLLVHAKPGWTPYPARDDSQESLAQLAKERHFRRHPFARDRSPFFPDLLLGADCANWARDTAFEFADDFFLRLGVKPAYRLKSRRRWGYDTSDG